MSGVVADTHTVVWYLSKDSRLSSAALAALTTATTGGDLIHIPSICLVELTYLAEKGRLPSVARDTLIEALDDPTGPIYARSARPARGGDTAARSTK